MSCEKVLKKSIKNINFDLIANDICDPSILYTKFLTQYNLCKQFLIAISHLHNSYPKTSFKEYVLSFKDELYRYRQFIEYLQGITFLNSDINTELNITFKTFSKGPLIESMMFTYKKILTKDTSDPDWVTKSRSILLPFKDCNISVSELYRNNKTIVYDQFKSIKNIVDKFYCVFVKPNFDLDKAIDRMCDYLLEIHKKGEVKCDLIPGYVKKVHAAKVLDIEKLNLAYLETDNKAIFVTELMNSLLNVDNNVVKPNLKTHMQIKRLLMYIGQKNNDPRLTSTIKAGQSLIGLSEKEGLDK